MSYRGFYITLDQSIERRNHVEKQLSACNLESRYTRFPACVGNALNLKAPNLKPGQIGCFSSHYLLLKSQVDSPEHLHITEDDVVFSPVIATILDSLLAKGALVDYDLLYTEVSIPIDRPHIRDLALRFHKNIILNEDGTIKSVKNFSVLPLKDRIFSGTVSYMVNKNSIAKVASILEEAAHTEITMPIDLYFRENIRAGRIKAGCLFPFVTTVDLKLNKSSTVELSPRKNLETSIFASALLRNLFYVHSKPAELLAACQSVLGQAPMNDRDKVLAGICCFGLSANYEQF